MNLIDLLFHMTQVIRRNDARIAYFPSLFLHGITFLYSSFEQLPLHLRALRRPMGKY